MKCKILLVLALNVFLCSCSRKNEIEGTWTAISAEKDARVQRGPSQDQLSKATLTFTGDKYLLSVAEKQSEGIYRLDPKKQPKEIELSSGGPSSLAGIYKLEGQELTLCLTPVGGSGSTKPQSFDAPPGSGRFLIVLKRQ